VLTRRVIACLDVKAGRVVKGVHFEGLREVGDPAALAARHEAAGADELVLLDVSASSECRATLLEAVERTARVLSVPLTVGGGVRTAGDVARLLRAGADKVAINTAAVADPALLRACAERFGSQCVVASVDARREGAGWTVWTHGATRPTGLDAADWAATCVERGAGEVLLTSVDRDGTRSGYDLALTKNVVDRVRVPVVASGGAGSVEHVGEVLAGAGADAALVAGIVHDGGVAVAAIKEHLRARGLPVRRT
jgi:cyclase